MTAAASDRVLECLASHYPEEVARLVEPLEAEESGRIIAGFGPETAAAVLGRLTLHSGAEVLEHVPPARASDLIGRLEANRAAALLARLDPTVSDPIAGALTGPAQREIRALMEYRADSAGSLMDPSVTTFQPDATTEQVLDRVRGLFPKRIFDVFLVDGEGVLLGTAGLQDIATAGRGTLLADLARRDPPSIAATATLEEVGELIERQRVSSLPVVDFSNRVVGVIRYGSLMNTVENQASADIQTMVGVSRDERALSGIGFVVRKRLPWLQVNLATAFVAASVVGLFEETIAAFTALAVLLPVVAGQSGNTGAQALAVIMRGLSLREITPRHAARVLTKEVSVAFINGVAVAVVTGVGVLVWSGSAGLATVTAVAMVSSMVCAGLAGAAIPIVLQLIGQDPAQSSSIILTTVTDVIGFFSFLGLATLFSSML
jgi:magnesium transporter